MRTWSNIPMPIEATKARGKDTIPPIIAATRPRNSVSGPMATRSVDVESVAMRITAKAERNPAMVHTAVDTILGLIPVRRARSGLETDARTDSPNRVWFRSHQSPSVVTGTAMRARTWAPLTVMPAPTFHWPLMGSGNVVCSVPVW